MTTPHKKDKNENHGQDYSDNEFTFKELHSRYDSLKIQQLQLLILRKDLLLLNEKNETTSKRLLNLKTDYEHYKSQLQKTLFNLNISVDKETILLKKKLDKFFEKRKAFEEYYKVSPVKHKLEKLISENKILEDKFKCKADLFELTKTQFDELLNLVLVTFKKKVCEFCDVVLRLKEASN